MGRANVNKTIDNFGLNHGKQHINSTRSKSRPTISLIKA